MAPLQDQLDEITANTRSLVQEERLAIGERAVAELFASGIEDKRLKVGDQAPHFRLPDASGKLVDSRDLLALGPLVIDFFRGRWCPYCVTEFEVYRDLYQQLREMGALVVAISPQTLRQNDFAVQQHGLQFPVLRDAEARVAGEYGLAYQVPEYQRDYYKSMLVNLPFINGEDSWRLAIPGTFVVNEEGVIVFSEAHADFRVRPEPTDVVVSVAQLTKK